MATLDFVSSKEDKGKKGVNLLTFASIVVFIIAIGGLVYVGMQYFNRKSLEEDLATLRIEQSSASYKEAMAFKQIDRDLQNIENNYIGLGSVLGQIYDATIEGVVFESVSFTRNIAGGGGEIKLQGIFSDLYLIDEQVLKYQEIEADPVVSYSLNSDNIGKAQSQNAQAADISITIF